MPEPPISFARGAPAPELVPAAELADCANAVALRDGARIFAYGPGSGYAPLREWVAERHAVDPARVVLTTGGLQGFAFYAAEQLARRPGRVLVEAPTYDRPLTILAREGAEVVALEMDEEGLVPDALVAELRGRSERPAFLYTIPTFQNPSGRTLSGGRRREIVEIAREHELPVLEDDPYGLVRYEGEAPPSLLELEGGALVTYTSSFSKTVAPGVRTGYFVLPERRGVGVRGARGLDVHQPAVPHPGHRRGVRRARSVRAEPRPRVRGVAGSPRRDARRARGWLRRRRDVEPTGGWVLRLARRSRRGGESARSARRKRASRSSQGVRSSRADRVGERPRRASRSATRRLRASPKASSCSRRYRVDVRRRRIWSKRIAGCEPDSDAEQDQDEQRDLRGEEDEADLDLLAIEEDDEDRVDGEHPEDDQPPRRALRRSRRRLWGWSGPREASSLPWEDPTQPAARIAADVLGCVIGGGGLERPRNEWRLARRGEQASRRRAKGGARDIARERAQPFLPEVAVVAREVCSFLRRHRIVRAAPLGRPPFFRPGTEQTTPGTTNRPQIAPVVRSGRSPCKISISRRRLPVPATPVENSQQG